MESDTRSCKGISCFVTHWETGCFQDNHTGFRKSILQFPVPWHPATISRLSKLSLTTTEKRCEAFN